MFGSQFIERSRYVSYAVVYFPILFHGGCGVEVIVKSSLRFTGIQDCVTPYHTAVTIFIKFTDAGNVTGHFAYGTLRLLDISPIRQFAY